MDGKFYSVSTIEMFERMFVAMGKAVFEGVHRDDWVDMVHHRIGDAIKSRKERGDVDRESDGANQIVHKRKATYQDVVHKLQKFAAATDKMAKTQTGRLPTSLKTLSNRNVCSWRGGKQRFSDTTC